MKMFNRSSKTPQQQPQGRGSRRRPRDAGEGTNATQRQPDPQAEPIPDGEHKYVPRSPYRTGNS
jgi:hypothetical protein